MGITSIQANAIRQSKMNSITIIQMGVKTFAVISGNM